MRPIALAALLAAAFTASPVHAAEDDAARAQRWHDLAAAIFDGRQPAEVPGWVQIDAPMRALDASLVPITFTVALNRQIKALYVVVDENPSPIAAHVVFGPAADPHTLSLRVRVDQYTNVHAVVEAADGSLIATSRFIKGAGGCSALGLETPEIALQSAGRMKLRLLARDGADQEVAAQNVATQDGVAWASLLIRHPNFNGMQMDQVTRHYTPARYVNNIDVAYNGQSVFHMDADISLASDPAIGFGFKSDGNGTVSVDVADSTGAAWHQDFPVTPPGT